MFYFKTNSSSPKTSRISIDTSHNTGTQDLLGLASPTSANGTNAAGSAKHSTVIDLGAGDAFTSFLSASPTPAGSTNSNTSLAKDDSTIAATVSSGGTANSSLAKEEQDFFNQVPTEKEKIKMTKDSIMALYATAPNPNGILGQFNGNIGVGTGSGAAFSQFTSPIAGYTIPHAQMNTPPNLGAAYGPPLVAAAQTFGCTIPSAIPNAFGAQMIGGYQQSPLQQPQHHQQQFATFPPIGAVAGVGAPAPMQATAASFQMPQQFTHATATAPTNGTLNQQFANLNVWQ